MYRYKMIDNKSWARNEGIKVHFAAKSLKITFGFSTCASHQQLILSLLILSFNNLLPTIPSTAYKLWALVLQDTEAVLTQVFLIICNN